VLSDALEIARIPGFHPLNCKFPGFLAPQRTSQGWFLSLSLGEKGSPRIPQQEYGATQRQAAEKAAALLRAKALFLEYPDAEIPISDEAKIAVCDLIREYKPATIVTHWN
jgi:LmbE family N-acetylglucosaminyl deacetylase